MAQIMPAEAREALGALAKPLMETALVEAGPYTLRDPNAMEGAFELAHNVQGFQFAVTALLDNAELAEGGLMIAMGAATATVLAQCQTDRTILWAMFQAQFKATYAEVCAAQMTPVGNA